MADAWRNLILYHVYLCSSEYLGSGRDPLKISQMEDQNGNEFEPLRRQENLSPCVTCDLFGAKIRGWHGSIYYACFMQQHYRSCRAQKTQSRSTYAHEMSLTANDLSNARSRASERVSGLRKQITALPQTDKSYKVLSSYANP